MILLYKFKNYQFSPYMPKRIGDMTEDELNITIEYYTRLGVIEADGSINVIRAKQLATFDALRNDSQRLTTVKNWYLSFLEFGFLLLFALALAFVSLLISIYQR